MNRPGPLANPLGLPRARPFMAWSASSDGLSLALYYDDDWGDFQCFVAETSEAVHCLIAWEPFRAGRWKALDGDALAYNYGYRTDPPRMVVWLAEPIGDRAVVDGTSGRARPRIDAGGDVWSLLRNGTRDDWWRGNPEGMRERRWSYRGEAHRAAPFAPRPADPERASRSVPRAVFDGNAFPDRPLP